LDEIDSLQDEVLISVLRQLRSGFSNRPHGFPWSLLPPSFWLPSSVEFWRQHGEPLMKSAPYPEIAPHLVLLTFLHRVVNGGGRLDREYAIGSGHMDLLLTYGKSLSEPQVFFVVAVDPAMRNLRR